MKKTMALVLIICLLVVAFTACSDTSATPDASTDSTVQTTAAASDTESTEEPQLAGGTTAEDTGVAPFDYLEQQQANYGWTMPAWYTPATDEQLQMAKQTEEDLEAGKILSNPDSALYTDLPDITDEQASSLNGLTAAICMRWTGSFWPNQLIAGITNELESYGVDIIATTDANSDEATQIANIQSVIAMEPDILIIHPVSESAITDVCKEAAAAGIVVVFEDQSAYDLTPGVEYVSTITCDNYLNGMRHADLMAQALEGKETKNVGIMYFGYEFTATNDRFEGFVTRIASMYQDINLIAISPFEDATATESVASAMLTAHSDLDGIYTEWDEPAIGILSAGETAGIDHKDLAITTDLMSDEVVLSLAENGYVKGISSQDPYAQGVTGAKAALLKVLGVDVPTYISVVPFTVTRENLAESYENLVGQPLFAEAVAVLEK